MLNEKYRLIYTTSVVLCLSMAAPLLLMYIITPWIASRVSQTAYVAISEICFWAMGIGVMFVVIFWERQSLRSIGLRRLTVKEGLLSLLLGTLLFMLIPASEILMKHLFGITTGTTGSMAAFAKTPIWLSALFATRPGLVEEILYRGYLIERLNRLTGSIWLGALISPIIHTAIHISSWNLGHILGIVFPLSVILTGLYVWKRNLTLNITVHFLIDFLALVLLPRLPQLS